VSSNESLASAWTRADAQTLRTRVRTCLFEQRIDHQIIQGPARCLALMIMSGMPIRLHHIVIDAHELPSLARFWAEALGWTVLSSREREVVIGPSADAPVGLCFMPAGPTAKTVKNRMHMDLTTTADDRDSEIERLIGLGARRVDVGQTEQASWDVLADPEGNEFCVVRPKTSLVD
jgi:predicted enzyme related to lactoylglutathione lyase